MQAMACRERAGSIHMVPAVVASGEMRTQPATPERGVVAVLVVATQRAVLAPAERAGLA